MTPSDFRSHNPQSPQTRTDRLNLAEQLYTRFYKPWQVMDTLRRHFGISENQARTDYEEAIERFHKDFNADKTRLRERLTDALLEIIRSPHAEPKDQNTAAKIVAGLWGLFQLPAADTQTQKVMIEVGNWRERFIEKAESGTLKRPGGNGSLAPKAIDD